jgi:hypothetical protein
MWYVSIARETLNVLNLKDMYAQVSTQCHTAHIKSIIQFLPYFLQQVFLYGCCHCDDPLPWFLWQGWPINGVLHLPPEKKVTLVLTQLASKVAGPHSLRLLSLGRGRLAGESMAGIGLWTLWPCDSRCPHWMFVTSRFKTLRVSLAIDAYYTAVGSLIIS